MLYYKVPAKFDQKQCYKANSSKRIPNGYYLVANELLTAKECERMNAPIDLLEPVTIKKTLTYFCFGARFA